MVATGVTSISNMPEFNSIEVTVPIIHSKDLGSSFDNLDKDNIQNAVVLGAAKSTYDAVYLFLFLGKSVNWVVRPDGAGPWLFYRMNCLGISVALKLRLLTS